MVRVCLLFMCWAAGSTGGCGKKSERSTGNGQATDTNQHPITIEDVPLQPLDLRAFRISASIHVPGNVRGSRKFGTVELARADGSFAVQISASGGAMTRRKQTIASNDLNKLLDYIVEEENAILYESQRQDQTEFHVLVQATVGDAVYECQDRKGPRFTLTQAHTMLRACKTLAAAPAPGPRP